MTSDPMKRRVPYGKQSVEIDGPPSKRSSAMSDVIHEWVEKAMLYEAREREHQIRLALQPKPRWLPTWAWHRIVARLLVMEERPLNVDYDGAAEYAKRVIRSNGVSANPEWVADLSRWIIDKALT